MAATEDISLRIALDDRQAQAGLDSLRQETANLAKTAEGAAGGIGAISTKVDKARGVIEPTATAVNGMASAFGGLNSQTGAVLGGVSNLASAFMAGGPLAMGLVTIGTAISGVTTAYQENKKAAEEAAKKQQEAIDKIVQVGLNPLEAATLRLNQAKKELELQNMLTGKDSDQLVNAMRPIVLEIESLDAQIGAAQRQIKLLKLEAVEGIRRGESIEQMKARRQEAEKQIKPMEAQLNLLRQAKGLEIERIKIVDRSTRAIMDRTKALEAEAKAEKDAEQAKKDAKREAEKEAKESEKNQKFVTKVLREEIDKRKKAREKEAQEQMAQQELVGPTRAMFEKEQDRIFKEQEKAEKAKTEAIRKAAEERKKLQEQELKSTVDMYKNLLASVIGAGQTLIDDLITGQEKALERFAVAVMRQAGTFMLGKGLELGAQATFNVLSGNPVLMAQAPAQFAGAAALVGGGVALGAVATGVEHVAINGGQVGQSAQPGGGAGDRAISTPMGAGRISTGGTGDRDGGGMEQVTYVFNAPVFGDQNRSARHVAALQRRGQRNLLLA